MRSLRAHARTTRASHSAELAACRHRSPSLHLAPLLVAITALASVGFPAFPTVAQGALAHTEKPLTFTWPETTPWPHANHACFTRECNTTAAHADDESTGVAALTVDEDDELTELAYLVYTAVTVFFWVFLINSDYRWC